MEIWELILNVIACGAALGLWSKFRKNPKESLGKLMIILGLFFTIIIIGCTLALLAMPSENPRTIHLFVVFGLPVLLGVAMIIGGYKLEKAALRAKEPRKSPQ